MQNIFFAGLAASSMTKPPVLSHFWQQLRSQGVDSNFSVRFAQRRLGIYHKVPSLKGDRKFHFRRETIKVEIFSAVIVCETMMKKKLHIKLHP